jgi:hypothetical protein
MGRRPICRMLPESGGRKRWRAQFHRVHPCGPSSSELLLHYRERGNSSSFRRNFRRIPNSCATSGGLGPRHPAHRLLLEISALASCLLLRPTPLWPINVPYLFPPAVSHFWGPLQTVPETPSPKLPETPETETVSPKLEMSYLERTAITSISTNPHGAANAATCIALRAGLLGCSLVPKNCV